VTLSVTCQDTKCSKTVGGSRFTPDATGGAYSTP